MNSPEKKPIEELFQTDVFQRISEICNSVAITLNAKELLELSLQKTMALFDAKRGSIFILNEDGKELILKIAHGMKISEQEKMVKRLGEGVVGKVAEMKKPLFVEDISQDSRFQDYKPRAGYKTHSFICAPLMIKDQLVGVINIADKASDKQFTKNELQLLDFISSQIALNYRRTQLYEKFKNILKESKNLKDELGKTSQVTDKLKRQVVVQEKLASIGKLTAGIAHELNNPLDGVLRYINLSLGKLKEDDVIYGYLLEAKQGLNRMVNIVRSLLACSRNNPPTLKKIDVNNAIEEAVSGVRTEMFHKNIALKKHFAEHLPQLFDFGIERIVSNLLHNAIDAINSEGKIEIKTAQKDSSIIIEISDTGCGIAPEVLQEIFEPFYTTKDIDKGCGLGLTIVNEIVKSYGGKIDIESTPKKGSVFTINLPLQEEYAERTKT